MWILFEIVIFGYLILTGAFLIGFAVAEKRRRLLWPVVLVLAVGWGLIFYGSFVEPRRLVTSHEIIELDPTPETQVRVAVFADPHLGPYKGERWMKEVVDKVMTLDADLILIPGDFIFSDADEVMGVLPIQNLSAPLGVYAVTGNHDYTGNRPQEVVDALKSVGVEVLENTSTTISVDGHELVLAGLSDLWFAAQPQETMEGLSSEQTVVLLSHNPDIVLHEAASVADMVVSGHTHGGQIRLPLIGSLSRVPTQLGNKYDKGLFDYTETQQLFITAGVGETGPRARLFNTPEINLLTVRF